MTIKKIVAESKYPEHDKLELVSDEATAVGDFITWLDETKGYSIRVYVPYSNNGLPRNLHYNIDPPTPCPSNGSITCLREYCQPNPEYVEQPSGYYAVSKSVHDWLYEFFEIDPKVLEAEKRAMLDEQRERNRVQDQLDATRKARKGTQ